MKRSPLHRRTPLRRRKALAYASARRVAYQAELDRVRPLVAKRSGGRCEAFELISGEQFRCHEKALVVHHILPRSHGGGNQLANLLHLCVEDHRRIHANPSWAYEMGFLAHSWEETRSA